jgi:hypothetical protein
MQAVFRDESLTLSAGMAEEAKRKLLINHKRKEVLFE